MSELQTFLKTLETEGSQNLSTKVSYLRVSAEVLPLLIDTHAIVAAEKAWSINELPPCIFILYDAGVCSF